MYQDFLFKSVTIAVLAVLVLFTGFALVGPLDLSIKAVTTQEDKLFSVNDSAKVLATPDTATVQVAVVKEAGSVEDLQTELNEANNAMTSAIKSVGIAEDDIKTVMYSIYPKYRYNPEDGTQSIDGYMATSRLEIRTSDFDKINQVVDVAVKAGANEVGQVNFVVDDRDAYVAQARKEAIEGAKAKAEAIADEAGIDLGQLVNVDIYENGEVQPPVFYEKALATGMGGGGDTSIQAGQNEIVVNVTLSYALQ